MIAAILASTNAGGIGYNGTLPWPKHREDLQWFREHTTNNIVVMGRKTWNDPMMPKPLPNRVNYVVSSQHVAIEHRKFVTWIPGNPAENILNIEKKHPDKTIFVIGGKKLYEACMPVVQRVYLTRIKGNYWTDTRVNLDRMLSNFRLYSVTPSEHCTFEIWDRI